MNETGTYPMQIDLTLFGEATGGPSQSASLLPSQTASLTAAPKGEPRDTAQAAPTEDKRRAFRALIGGEYKAQYAEETQKLINRRFRETETLRRQAEAAKPLLALLGKRYGVPEGDVALLAEAVARDMASLPDGEAARSVAAPAQLATPKGSSQSAGEPSPEGAPSAEAEPCGAAEATAAEARRDGRARFLGGLQLQAWERQAEALRAEDPDFRLEDWESDALFRLLLRHNYPLRQAYRAANVDALLARAAAEAERAVAAHIRAGGSRPAEAGAAASPAFAERRDVSLLTDAEVRDVLARIGGKEKISFG